MRILICAISLLLMSCGGAVGPDLSGLTPGSSTSNPVVGVTTNASFYVHVFDQGYFPFYLNKAGAAWGTDCAIDNSLSNQSISCYLDINEMDVYHGVYSLEDRITLQYNVPTGMCSYFSFMPAWYYNREIGIGPTAVEVDTAKDTDGNITSRDCVIDGTPYAGCTGMPEVHLDENGKPVCDYECCTGYYDLTLVETVAGGSPVPSVQRGLPWPQTESSNAFKTCLGGQVRTNWKETLFTRGGFPVAEVTYVQSTGKNDIYRLYPPIQDPNGNHSVGIANYYFDVSHTHTGYVLPRSSDLPYAVDPIDDITGDDLSGYIASEAYDFRCLDKNREVVNRIRLYIRAWNTYSAFLAYGSSSGVTYDPNVVGTEGGSCDGVLGYCDDFVKWDSQVGVGHFSSDLIGPYSTGNRYRYFPRERYSTDP